MTTISQRARINREFLSRGFGIRQLLKEFEIKMDAMCD